MTVQLIHGDCLEVMKTLPTSSVDLILTDPPYYKVKGDAWDRAWDTPEAFLAWFDQVAEQWHRLLKPNGSLYAFAWPKIAARVEVLLAERFEVLNTIKWIKDAGWHRRAHKLTLRTFFPTTESIIFAEHKNAPLRTYLATERDRAGFTTRRVAEAFQKKSGSRTVTGMAGHWFERVQWTLPTAANYQWLRDLFNREQRDQFLRREYEDLRREYEDLRREYEDLRRPFCVTADVPYTDVWTFPTVSTRGSKHPCEKPLAMMEHIIRASSRPGAVVLDSFMGSGVVGEAAVRLGRDFIGIEADPEWLSRARARIETRATP